MRPLDPSSTIKPSDRPSTLIELRGESGRLYGLLDPKRLTIEVKRKGERPEQIDLRPYLETRT